MIRIVRTRRLFSLLAPLLLASGAAAELADPFRWLEDLEAEKTRAWVRKRAIEARAHLDALPEREALQKRLAELWNFERTGVPVRRGERLFFAHNTGLQAQDAIHLLNERTGHTRNILSPASLSDAEPCAVRDWVPSPDGKLLAYAASEKGSDWMTWRVRDVETGKDLPDRIPWSRFSSATWAPDGSGFYASLYDAPPPGEESTAPLGARRLVFHRLGDPAEKDSVVFTPPKEHPDLRFFHGTVTEDGRYLAVTAWRDTGGASAIYLKDLGRADAPLTPLIDTLDGAYEYVSSRGTFFWLRTTVDAPRGRIVGVDLADPHPRVPRELVPQGPDVLAQACRAENALVLVHLRDARSTLSIHNSNGSFRREVALPGVGTVRALRGSHRQEFFHQLSATRSDVFLFSFTGFTTPETVFRGDGHSGALEPFRAPGLLFDADAFESRQVFVTSRDGTRIPLFINHRKGLPLDGKNPAFLYGYGGFGTSMLPRFSPADIAWMERGGVFAVACLRGGGEYGEEWHRAGMKERKQNTFDDMIAAAEWLVANRYTAPARLGIGGHSNGGLTAAACLVRRPDLFGAAVIDSGVLDLLRFHLNTVGWSWTNEYGSPDDPEEAKRIAAWSPLHNLKKGTRYPPVLILTADHDDRVIPWHSYKFAAALKDAQGNPNAPVLLRVETDAGHGRLTPTERRIEQWADRWAFLLDTLGRKDSTR